MSDYTIILVLKAVFNKDTLMRWYKILWSRHTLIYILIGLGFTNSSLGLITGQKWHALRFLNLSPESLVFHEPQFFWDKRLVLYFTNGEKSELGFAEIKKLDPTNSLFHAVLFGPSIPKMDRERIISFTICSKNVKKVYVQYLDRANGQVMKEFEWRCPN